MSIWHHEMRDFYVEPQYGKLIIVSCAFSMSMSRSQLRAKHTNRLPGRDLQCEEGKPSQRRRVACIF